MQYGLLGNTNLKFSKIILGTWQAGKWGWVGIDDNQSIEAIRRAVELGITTIDTASLYGEGHSERIIAEALKKVPRNKYQLATKVFCNKLKFKDVLEECDKSLKNLQTDSIELYQIHCPSGSFGSEIVPLEETMKALNQLKSEGKIQHIGVSNFSKEQLQEALQYAEIVSNQPPYSLLWRHYDKVTNPFCRAKGMSILAYSSLAQGLLTGKYKKNHTFERGDNRMSNLLTQPKIFERVERVVDGLKFFADKYKTSIGNIAINWLMSQINTFAIVGMRNVQQVNGTALACEFQLTPNDLREIEELGKLVTENMDQTEGMWDLNSELASSVTA